MARASRRRARIPRPQSRRGSEDFGRPGHLRDAEPEGEKRCRKRRRRRRSSSCPLTTARPSARRRGRQSARHHEDSRWRPTTATRAGSIRTRMSAGAAAAAPVPISDEEPADDGERHRHGRRADDAGCASESAKNPRRGGPRETKRAMLSLRIRREKPPTTPLMPAIRPLNITASRPSDRSSTAREGRPRSKVRHRYSLGESTASRSARARGFSRGFFDQRGDLLGATDKRNGSRGGISTFWLWPSSRTFFPGRGLMMRSAAPPCTNSV